VDDQHATGDAARLPHQFFVEMMGWRQLQQQNADAEDEHDRAEVGESDT